MSRVDKKYGWNATGGNVAAQGVVDAIHEFHGGSPARERAVWICGKLKLTWEALQGKIKKVRRGVSGLLLGQARENDSYRPRSLRPIWHG